MYYTASYRQQSKWYNQSMVDTLEARSVPENLGKDTTPPPTGTAERRGSPTEFPSKHLPKTPPRSTTESPNLPSGFESVVATPKKLEVTPQDLRWLEKEEKVNLVLVTLGTSSQQQFYFGSLIRGKKLVESANQLTEGQERNANNLLYARLPDMIQRGYSPHSNTLSNPFTRQRPIIYFANPGGQRVYVVRFGEIEGIPAIIRIAVCDKAQQAKVLSVLTNSSHKEAKQKGRL